MKKGKKDSSYIGFALVCIILGAILISVGSFLKNDLGKGNNELIDITAKVASYEQIEDGKVNVICKYGYEGNEYNYVCHTDKKDEAMKNYKIGMEQTIKVNKSNPGRITVLDLSLVILAIYSIGLIFLLIAILYLISEVIRLCKK